MKKVLLITPYFPPSASAGAIRPAKFAKYLPEFDWQPIIITPNQEQGDISNEAEFPVYSVRFPDLEKLFGLARSLFPKSKGQSNTAAKSAPTVSLRTRREVFTEWLIPDDRITWVPFAIKQGLAVEKTHSCQAVLTTAPQFSCHLVGLFLARRLNCPWIADFRDPWLTNPFIRYPTSFHKRIHAILEGKVIKSANRVITISEPIRQDFLSRYPDQNHHKFNVIYNGYDSEDFVGLETRPDPPDKKIHIIHTGTFYGQRNPNSFLQVLRLLDPFYLKHIKITFLGRNASVLQSIINQLELDQVVTLKEFLPHRQSLQHLIEADILLLIPGPGSGTLTTKLFEYLNAGKFIFALVPPDNKGLISLLTESNLGFVVDPDSPDEISSGLSLLIQMVRSGQRPKPNWEFIQQFDRKRLTGQLAQILDKITQ